MEDKYKCYVNIKLGEYFYAYINSNDELIKLYVFKKIIIKSKEEKIFVFMDVVTKKEIRCKDFEFNAYFTVIEKCKDNVYFIYANIRRMNTFKCDKVNNIKLCGKDNINDIAVFKILKIRNKLELSALKSAYKIG